MALIRQEVGDVLRDFRTQKGQTLRHVASRANVALGYLSEVERGQKEASSEILAALAAALEVPVSVILREVSDRLALVEAFELPDAVEQGLAAGGVSKSIDEFDAFLIGAANGAARTQK